MVWRQFHVSFYTFSLLRFGLALGVLLVPTTFMGGTLPVLSKFYGERREEVGFSIGRLYAVNTLGAVLGAAVAGFVRLPQFGMRTTTLTAIALNLFIGMLALILAYREGKRPVMIFRAKVSCASSVGFTSDSPALSEPPRARPVILAALLTFGLSGFAAMTYEVAWTRLLTLVLGSSTYAFATMLTTFLIGLALGGGLLARYVDRWEPLVFTLALCQVGIGSSAYLGEHLVQKLPYFFLVLFQSVGDSEPLFSVGQFLLASGLMFVPTLLMGAVFPVVIKIVTHDLGSLGQWVGNAYGINTAGTVLGSFAVGFFLLPTLGIENTITLAIGINLFCGIGLLWLQEEVRSRVKWTALGATVWLAMAALAGRPSWNPLVMSSGVYKDAPLLLQLYKSPREAFQRMTRPFRLLYYREGTTTTVTVVERPSLEGDRHLALAIDGKVDASTGADMPTQVLSGHLPLLYRPAAKKVLVIGYASGVTVGSVEQYPVQEIVAVEIEPAVMEASALFNDFNHRAMEDPRLRVIINDARNYLLATDEEFDVIISEPSNPWMSGPAKLFTKEFFQLGKTHLEPGGLFCQWLQLYGMNPADVKTLVRTFQSIFPYVVIYQTTDSDLLLLGSHEQLPLDFQSLGSRLPETKLQRDLQRVKVTSPLDILVRFRLGFKEIKTFVGSGPKNTDDNALIEFAAPRSLYSERVAANLEALRKASRGVLDYLTNVGTSSAEQGLFYFELAHKYLSVGEIDLAEEAAKRGLSLVSTALSADGVWLLGEVALRRQDQTKAHQFWEKALRRQPSHFSSLWSLARYDQHHQDYADAEKYLARLRASYPQHPRVRQAHGINLYYLGRHREAIDELKNSVTFSRRRDERPWAHYYLSLAHEHLRDSDAVERHRKKFIAELEAWRRDLEWKPPEPNLPGPLEPLTVQPNTTEEILLARLLNEHVVKPLTDFYQGVALYLLGYPEEAIQKLQGYLQTLQEQDEISLAHYYLGLAYKALKQTGLARRHLIHFIEHLPPGKNSTRLVAEAYRHLREMGEKRDRNDCTEGLPSQ